MYRSRRKREAGAVFLLALGLSGILWEAFGWPVVATFIPSILCCGYCWHLLRPKMKEFKFKWLLWVSGPLAVVFVVFMLSEGKDVGEIFSALFGFAIVNLLLWIFIRSFRRYD